MSSIATTSGSPKPRSSSAVFLQGLAFLALALLLAMAFSQQIFDGDSYHFAGKAVNGKRNIDPNHLLMGPIAFYVAKLVAAVGWGSVFGAFKVMSAVAVALSMFGLARLFHSCGIEDLERSSIALAGTLVSYYFSYSLLCEEFYAVQLPFLVFGACAIVSSLDARHRQEAVRLGIIAGVLLALAALVNLHNAVLCVFLGLLILLTAKEKCRLQVFGAYAVAGIVIGAAGLVWGYLAADTNASLISWVTSYGGEPDSKLDNMYGIDWSIPGVLLAIMRTVFSLLESIAYLGNLPAFIKGVVRGDELQFIPDITALVLGAAVCVLAAILWLVVTSKVMVGSGRDRVVRFAVTWLFAYILFGFYWDQKVAQFWFPVVPVFWLLLLRHPHAQAAKHRLGRRSRLLSYIALALLFVNNFGTAFNPNARTDMDDLSADYLEVVGDSAFVISPGWGMPWINYLHQTQGLDAVYLMEMALEKDGAAHLGDLHALVDRRLDSGARVFVNRLYDKDDNPRPWSDLKNLSWPRSRILGLLDGYCVSEPYVLPLIKVRELTRCDSDAYAPDRSGGTES